jgi:hypothetical protein
VVLGLNNANAVLLHLMSQWSVVVSVASSTCRGATDARSVAGIWCRVMSAVQSLALQRTGEVLWYSALHVTRSFSSLPMKMALVALLKSVRHWM